MPSIRATVASGAGILAFGGSLVVDAPPAQASVITTFTTTRTSPSRSARHAKPSPKATVSADWTKFFAGTTPPAEKIRLLENGQAFAAVIDAQAKLAIARSTTVKVLDITVETTAKASVRYTIEIGDAPALSNQTGISLYETGLWKVSDASFCALLALQGTKLKACPSTTAARESSVTVDVAKRGSYGTILVTSTGMTLYRYSKDTAGRSNCSGSCASIWPPLVLPKGLKAPTAGKGVSHLGTVRRANGKLQVSYDGEPLYLYQGDKSAGQVNGNGVAGFSVVKSGSATRSTTTSSGSGYDY